MKEAAALLAAGATLAGLAAWSRMVATRALGEPQAGARKAGWWVIALLLALQLACAIAAAGPAGGATLVACAWTLLGWPYGMALNAWPARTLAWSQRSGWAALFMAWLALVW